MTTMTKVGDSNPALLINIQKDDCVFCEAGALVMMDHFLDMDATTGKRGLLSALARNMFTGETLFQQRIRATRGAGDCLVAPPLPGDVMVLDVDENNGFLLNTGAYLASTDGIQIKSKTQGVANALFADTGGFVILKASGSGQLAVCGFGDLLCVDVSADSPLVIDNTHVVCWDSRLEYDLMVGTSSSSGWMRNMFNFAVGGEGILLRFSGTGKVIVATRNIDVFKKLFASSRNAR